MKKMTVTSLLLTPLLGAAFGLVPVASAETRVESLGSDASAIDRYQVVCTAGSGGDAVRLATQVSNTTAGAPLMSVQTYKDGKASNTTDTASGDGGFSPVAHVNAGTNGTYYVAVDKTGAGTADYTLQVQCETEAGAPAGTAIDILQNQ